jgi:pyruvate,water dikinase
VERYLLKEQGRVLLEGRSVGHKISSGTVRVITSLQQMDQVQEGDVLVTDMTDPDWEPVMKRARAIVTNRGGRTCHAAIIARELGVPAVVGCGNATELMKDGQQVTVSCAEGDTGYASTKGRSIFRSVPTMCQACRPAGQDHDERRQPRPRLRFRQPAQRRRGAGAPRVHHQPHDRRPPEGAARIREPAGRSQTEPSTGAWPAMLHRSISMSRKLVEGIATMAPPFAQEGDRALSDFKSNEYANLIGGTRTSRTRRTRCSVSVALRATPADQFRDCFELECRGAEAGARGDGLDQRRGDGALRAHRRRSAAGVSNCWQAMG